MNERSFRVLLERIRIGLARRVGFDVDLLKSATSIEVLDPGETISGSPCIALPEQYERVNACAFGIDPAQEIAQLKGAPRSIGPTIQYVLDNVVVNEGIIYGRGRHKFFNTNVVFQSDDTTWVDHGEAALRSSFVGCHFFGHWLRDDSATHLLASNFGTPVSMPTPFWPDRAGYLGQFGQQCVELRRAYINRLFLFDDINQNAHKAKRFRTLRARLANGPAQRKTGHIAYLMRGSGGTQRLLLNEGEIIDALTQRGVTVVKAETLNVSQLVSELLGARIIISVEGSQLSHALFTLQDSGGILVIQPPDRFFNSHLDWARALNMQYGVVVGEKRKNGFFLPVHDLLKTIDLLDKEIQ
ncbi:glycosyltransferase 61 family protein [Bradyrhizobium sp. sBnM-33]|uniref:glycosyltransferase 61 family protein n=1 Tax=Bradyrhizobium sp. sBnM-33 TaxID=2831780 RepID=UPI0020BED80A|nr:glycosyltransferase family 61 protein [Bradyrhizobium sp. sBnM-33]WOH53728.1 glycosyltransferase family 61 protein [Bradyrhizobium sp. sBnM-33]